ncbi:hypothetical protein ACQKE4_08085 [Halomonas sp. NPDC076908]|uniref:hypothetical protein n=1 Tax=Halomonas sp. NPDC076908 TaxID=3390567 RepID=UPI003D06E61A
MATEFVCVISDVDSFHRNHSFFQSSIDRSDLMHGSLVRTPSFYREKLGKVGGKECHFFSVHDQNENIPVIQRGDAFTFFDGEAVYKGAHSRQHEVEDYFVFSREARGSYCLLSYNQCHSGVVKVTNDPMGLYPVLYVSCDDFVVITNTPIWAETVLKELYGVYLRRSDEHVINEIVTGAPLDVGPYEGMRYLPFDSELTVSEKGSVVKNKRGVSYYYKSSRDEFEGLLEKAKSEICSNVLSVAKSEDYDYKISDISGGIDSRMILAAILATGTRSNFFFNTTGSYPNPDSNVGNYIIEKYSLQKCNIQDPLSKSRRGSFSDNPGRFIKTFCYASSGMKNNVARHVESKDKEVRIFKLGGGFSAYKANKSKLLSGSGNVALDQAVHLLTKGQFCIDGDRLDKVRGKVKNILHDWVVNDAMSIASALDRFHIEHRGRFHIGVCEHWGRHHGGKAHPLNSPSLVRASFSVSDVDRLNDVVTFSLMYKIFPSLVFVPIESRVWNPLAYAGYSPGVIRKLSKIKPVLRSSKRLYGQEPNVKKLVLSELDGLSVDQEKKDGFFCDSVSREVKSVSLWKRKQVRLNRKWYWAELDKVRTVFLSLFDEFYSSGYHIDSDFLEYLRRLKNKDLNEYKSIKEVLEMHCVTTLLVFIMKKEVEIKV